MWIYYRERYNKGILELLNGTDKFKEIDSDPAINRASTLQRFLQQLKKEDKIEKDIYNKIYPSGSQPASVYGLLILHKIRSSDVVPPFRPIASSVQI